MREIEKMMEIREKLTGGEQKKLDDSLRIVGDTFKKMVNSSRGTILNAEIENVVSFEEVQKALNDIKALAEKTGIEIPDFDTETKIKAYILKYGMEIVKTR